MQQSVFFVRLSVEHVLRIQETVLQNWILLTAAWRTVGGSAGWLCGTAVTIERRSLAGELPVPALDL